ncbi:hypothetical protein CBL_12027 [Carabus blaptoides fortunei]
MAAVSDTSILLHPEPNKNKRGKMQFYKQEGLRHAALNARVAAEKEKDDDVSTATLIATAGGAEEEPNQEYKENGAFSDIEAGLKRPADHANGLLEDLDKNMPELYYSDVAKFVGGKRTRFIQNKM